MCLASTQTSLIVYRQNKYNAMDDTRNTRIEQYLSGALPPEERIAFEAALRSDAELQREVRLYQAAHLALQAQSLLDHRARLQQRSRRLLRWRLWWWKTLDFLEDTFMHLTPEGTLLLRWERLATAGIAVMLLVAGIWWLRQTQLPAAEAPIVAQDTEVLYQAHFRRLELSQTLGAEDETPYHRARQYYAAGRCAEAMPLLEDALATPSFEARPMALLLKGACLLEAGRAAQALEVLRQVPPSAKTPYQEAEWYIALAYLQLGQRQNAVGQIERIARQQRHPHYSAARALLGQQ